MKFENYITELFTGRVDVKVDMDNNKYFRTVWNVNNTEYIFFAEYDSNSLKVKDKIVQGTWEMSFGTVTGLPILDTKGVLAVLNGAMESFKRFIKARQPEYFIFQASRGKLRKLYDRFSKQIVKMGYKAVGYPAHTTAGYYVFLKK